MARRSCSPWYRVKVGDLLLVLHTGICCHCMRLRAHSASSIRNAGVAAIESLLSSWVGSSSKAEVDGGGSSSSSSDDSEYVDSDSESESGSSAGSSSDSASGSGSSSGGGGGSSSSEASDIDKAELEALLDESRDVLADDAVGGGRSSKRIRR